MLAVGDNAPEFELESANGEIVKSKDLLGTSYVLYFYPKDNTPGCTKEAIDFTTLLKDFSDLGYKIFGVSPDSIKSHNKFITDKELKINLLSDPDKKVAEKFAAYGEKKNYGKTYFGIIRSTFLIDGNGKIVKAYYNVKATGHAEKVLGDLKCQKTM